MNQIHDNMLLIYVSRLSGRISYITELIFEGIMGVTFRITNDYPEYLNYNGPKFSYARSVPPEGAFLDAHPLLWETGITNQSIVTGNAGHLPVFFRSTEPRSLLPFDILAASFYLVSRYEEYLPFKPDQHGRFPATESLAFKENFLEIPVINLWAGLLKRKLVELFPGLSFHPPSYRFIPTIDVDHLWCFKGRSFLRTAGAICRSLIRFDINDLSSRIKVLSGRMTDPYDTFQMIDEWHHWNSSLPLFFILFADYGGNDNNVSIRNKEFRKLIQRIDREKRVGIHPSLSSCGKKRVLDEEINGLSSVLGRKIVHSRQHFLKITFPDTCNELLRAGVEHDYSLGYPSHPGFRAGIASPFPFFDLTKDRQTSLWMHPVAFMDVTFRDQLRLNPAQALEQMKELIRQVKEVNGELVTIWHNESLFGYQRWSGWEHVYPHMVRMASGK